MKRYQNLCTCGKPKHKNALQCKSCWLKSFVSDGKRICSFCNIEKDISDFRIRSRKIARPRSWCRKCEAQKRKEHEKNNPDKIRKTKTKWALNNPDKVFRQSIRSMLYKSKLISSDKVPDMVEWIVNHKSCFICGSSVSELSNDRLSLDHNHNNGKIRGLLCSKCNLGLGMFNDDIPTLKRAIKYVRDDGKNMPKF